MPFSSASRTPAAPLAASLDTCGISGGGADGGAVPVNPLTIITTALPTGRMGTPYTAFITSGGGLGTPHEFKLIAGGLPDGLTMQSVFGLQSTSITGTPGTVQVTTFTVEVCDRTGHTATRALAITIDPPAPLVITNQTSVLAPATVRSSYAAQLFADGGVRPYRWNLVAGTVPPGIVLDVSGRLWGTPMLVGTFTFTARISDSVGTQASRGFSISVGAAGTT
jgi:hypothetical protein